MHRGPERLGLVAIDGRLLVMPGVAATAAAGVVVDADRLVEAGQREDLAVVLAQADGEEPLTLALDADEQRDEQPDAATVHVVEAGEVEDDRRAPAVRRPSA